ncbi:MAG: hypothetical protein J7M26_10325, partial [Armatimonadetes bacterium]|nr:hypothetical protein [Armatimonadota bacterium]
AVAGPAAPAEQRPTQEASEGSPTWHVALALEGWRAEVDESEQILQRLAAEAGGSVVEERGAPGAAEGAASGTSAPVAGDAEGDDAGGDELLLALEPMQAVRFAVERPDHVREVNLLGGLVRAAQEARDFVEAQGWHPLPATAEDLYAEAEGPAAQLARDLKHAFDRENLLPPWHLEAPGRLS